MGASERKEKEIFSPPPLLLSICLVTPSEVVLVTCDSLTGDTHEIGLISKVCVLCAKYEQEDEWSV